MQIENSGYWLGRIGTKFFVWNEKKTSGVFDAKNIDEAVKKSKQIIQTWIIKNS